MTLVSFYTPWKHQKTSRFLMLTRGIEKNQWHEIGRTNIFPLHTPLDKQIFSYSTKRNSSNVGDSISYCQSYHAWCPQNGQTYLKDITTNIGRFLTCVLTFMWTLGVIGFIKVASIRVQNFHMTLYFNIWDALCDLVPFVQF